MMFDRKKAAGMILSKMKEGGKMSEGGEVAPEEMVDHDFAGLHAAAQDMMGAIHNKSAIDLHKALHSYLDLRKQLEPGEGPDNSPSMNEEGSEAGAQYKYNR